MHADGGPGDWTLYIQVGKLSSLIVSGPDGGPEVALNVPKECAVKVFKTTLNEFKTRDKYIREDYRCELDEGTASYSSCLRFKDRFSKQNPRKIIHMWAEKELHNLVKLSGASFQTMQARCPPNR